MENIKNAASVKNMEIVKKFLRSEQAWQAGELQLTLEEDLNLPETKPDVDVICFERGNVMIEETRMTGDAIMVKGKLLFSILYHTQENGGALERTEGKIPFEEKLRVEAAQGAEAFVVTGTVEDLTVTVINSRKLGIQSVITLEATLDQVREEELPVGVEGSPELRQKTIDVSQLRLCKKDVLRIKEDLSLPAGYPNVGRILWKNVTLGEMNFRLGDETLYVQGEANVFVLYEGEDEGAAPLSYDTVTSFSSEIACSGCREGDALDVRHGLSAWDVTPKADEDGEQRDFALEMTIPLRLCAYGQEQVEVVEDAYDVACNVQTKKRDARLRQMVRCVTGRMKVSDHLAPAGSDQITQLVHSEGEPSLVSVLPREGGITLRGSLGLQVFYATGEEERPYGCMHAAIPYEYSLEIPGMKEGDVTGPVQTKMEQLRITLQGGGEADVKAIMSFTVTAFREVELPVLDSLWEEAPGREKMAEMPSIVAYVVREGDDLWTIGKRYFVPVESLRERNHLTGDEVLPGQKLLIVKEA